MIPIAPHITAYLRERLPLERGASPHTCDSYAYTFRLLFNYAASRFNVTPSKLYLEQIDASLVMDFLADLEATRGNGAKTRNARLAAIKSFFYATSSTASQPCWSKACASRPSRRRRPIRYSLASSARRRWRRY
jgi:site-specific recombinase XerC